MAQKKSGGSTKNLRDSNPKYLGVKVADGERVTPGTVIVRQRGTAILPGYNVGVGKDHTLFSLGSGIVSFAEKRKVHFDHSVRMRKIVHVRMG